MSLAVTALAANGTFTGQVVNGPTVEDQGTWVYIQARRGGTRKVEISSAKVVFDEGVPKSKRTAKPQDAIREGAQVRVTASQDGAGEWKASRVEVIELAPR